MSFKHVMLQGTGSDVGKSLIVAGLCRYFANKGLHVAPFKPQNMSNNAAVTDDGGEIGRAQALQAIAARVKPTVHMNPVLLKPESGTGAQAIVQGQVAGRFTARQWQTARKDFLPQVLSSFQMLCNSHDLVISEGAGSPAEINLRAGDIANMGFAEAADSPVILVADIHRGGVIASVVGTFSVLPKSEQARIRGVIINNFHGDVSLFEDGVREIEARTRWPVLGVVPHIPAARVLPAEDALALEKASNAQSGSIHAVALRLPRIANFDDLDTLRTDPNVQFEMITPGTAIPGTADWVILPGSKSTRQDLEALKDTGWDIDIQAHVRRGGRLLGICGGYQMLGHVILDPDGTDGTPGSSTGLGLLDVETRMAPQKTVRKTSAQHVPSGISVDGYEIHMGHTEGPDHSERPLFKVENSRMDGAQSTDGLVYGTYLHGALDVRILGLCAPKISLDQRIDAALDRVAEVLAESLDLSLFSC